MILSADVLQAFSVSGKPQKLAGGEGESFLVDNVVMKPVHSEMETVWRSELLSNIPQNGFRLATPVKTKSGQWTYNGWEASVFVEGKAVKGRGKEKIAVSRKFHKSLENFEKPLFIKEATHPWAIADRMIWDEQKLEYGPELENVLNRLKALKNSVDLPSQLIHGDMTGNILFHPPLDPAIIDFSPYWRPAEYATAIIIVDSIVWENAPDELLNEIENTPAMNQLLVRAAMWRIKTTEEYIKAFGKGNIEDVQEYGHFIDLLEKRV